MDFRSWLKTQGQGHMLDYVGNDGGVDYNNLKKQIYGSGSMLGDKATEIRFAKSAANYDPSYVRYDNEGAIVKALFDKYNSEKKTTNSDTGAGSWGGGGFGFTGGRGGYSQDARNRADAIAKYDEEIREANDAMGGLGRKQEIGEHNIRHNMHDANVMADNDFNRAKGLYDMQTRDAIDRHKVARDEIEQDAASKIRSVQGILAAGGAGDSSFAKFLAPFKITEAATKQQGQVQDAYSRNRRDLDINYNTVENAYKQNKRKIENDGNARLQALRQKIATARQDLESRIRNANIAKQQANGSSLSAAISSQNAARDRINGIGAEIDDLGRDRSIPVDRVEWKAPSLDSYKPAEVEVKPGDVSSQIGGVKDQIAPNLQPLLEEKKKKEGLL